MRDTWYDESKPSPQSAVKSNQTSLSSSVVLGLQSNTVPSGNWRASYSDDADCPFVLYCLLKCMSESTNAVVFINALASKRPRKTLSSINISNTVVTSSSEYHSTMGKVSFGLSILTCSPSLSLSLSVSDSLSRIKYSSSEYKSSLIVFSSSKSALLSFADAGPIGDMKCFPSNSSNRKLAKRQTITDVQMTQMDVSSAPLLSRGTHPPKTNGENTARHTAPAPSIASILKASRSLDQQCAYKKQSPVERKADVVISFRNGR
mmetsp:Transcript_29998/g.46018  ORF Transcript_29998/g.46018 Transcript_29998/m.46018 type:complete len:262 (+) Transcript_29998:2254-3039(+)